MRLGRESRIGLVAIGLLGVLPLALRLLGVPANTPFAIVVLVANLAVCAWVYRKGQLRWFWVSYAVGCLVSVVLAGMTSPITLAVLLAFWRWL